jgi:membrane protein YdbS with pleckstrin-like domain
VEWHPVSEKLITVRLLGWAIWAVIVVGGGVALCLLWRGPWSIAITAIAAAILVWQGWLIPRRVRAMAYAVKDRDLYERHGIMFRHMGIVPYVRIQYVDINVGPIERSFGLASLHVNTAQPSLTVALAGIPTEVAAQLREVLTDRDRLTAGSMSPPDPQPPTGQAWPAPPSPSTAPDPPTREQASAAVASTAVLSPGPAA